MRVKQFPLIAALIGLSVAPALAQAPAPAMKAMPGMGAPAASAPAMTASPAMKASPAMTAPAAPTAMKATAPHATKATTKAVVAPIDINTASATQLEKLPGIGKARAKVITDERAKGKFVDWADFDKRTAKTSINAGVKSKIKDSVTF